MIPTLKELRDSKLMLYKKELDIFVWSLIKSKLDYDVWLPNAKMNLQRGLVWNLHQKREIIISIFKRRFIPHISLFAFNDKDTGNDMYQVIDGKQRLTSIIGFVNNEFTLGFDNIDWNFYDESEKKYTEEIRNFEPRRFENGPHKHI